MPEPSKQTSPGLSSHRTEPMCPVGLLAILCLQPTQTPLQTQPSEEPVRAGVFVVGVKRICQERRLSLGRAGVSVSTVVLYSFLPCFLFYLADFFTSLPFLGRFTLTLPTSMSVWVCRCKCLHNSCLYAGIFWFNSAFVFILFRLHCCCNALY